jgi:predicted small secreted protein
VINKSLIVLASVMLSSLLIAGCGGGSGDGNDAAEPPQTTALSVAPANVQLEGCVVNSQWGGAPDTAVHVRTADGRLLATVFTGRQGVFVVTVPTRSAIVLDTDVAGAGEITLNTGSGSFSVGACLRSEL